MFLTILLQLAVVYAPMAQPWLKTAPLPPLELGMCFAAALAVLVAVEGEKAWRRARGPNP